MQHSSSQLGRSISAVLGRSGRDVTSEAAHGASVGRQVRGGQQDGVGGVDGASREEQPGSGALAEVAVISAAQQGVRIPLPPLEKYKGTCRGLIQIPYICILCFM